MNKIEPSISDIINRLERDHSELTVFRSGPQRITIGVNHSEEFTSEDRNWKKKLSEIIVHKSVRASEHSGWVGWLGFEAFNEQPTTTNVPNVLFRYYPKLIHVNLQSQQWTSTPTNIESNKGADAETAEKYRQAVNSIIKHIREGSVYQVNLAWRTSSSRISNPIRLWEVLERSNPSRWGMVLRTRKCSIVCNSPETYLEISPQNIVRSTPIKGTRQAESQRLDLWASPKERSELTMIVDMVRNDIGASCVAGSVFATARKIVRCGDLLHAEQDVFGTLLSDAHRFSVLEQSFPPASVTGAPKSTAVQLIRQLEWSPRSIYTGSLGFILDSGYAHFNVAIRTIVMDENEQFFHTGAGIVYDSLAEAEWQETLDKGRAIRKSIAVEQRGT